MRDEWRQRLSTVIATITAVIMIFGTAGGAAYAADDQSPRNEDRQSERITIAVIGDLP
jgi:uncharacterized protein YijF (DUF1287 family)